LLPHFRGQIVSVSHGMSLFVPTLLVALTGRQDKCPGYSRPTRDLGPVTRDLSPCRVPGARSLTDRRAAGAAAAVS
jgi:hypothetical protein